MAITLEEKNGGKTLDVSLTGKPAKEDYETFVPAVERLVKQHGKIRMMVAMHDFHGGAAGALWEDTKFAALHFGDIARLAVVGDGQVAARHGGVLQDFYRGHDPLFRPPGVKRSAGVAGRQLRSNRQPFHCDNRRGIQKAAR